MVVAIPAEDRRNAYESLVLTQATLSNSGTPHSDDQLMGNWGIRLEKPRNAVQFRVHCKAHGVEHETELAVRQSGFLNLEFLNGNLMSVKADLTGEIRIAVGRQLMKRLLDLNQSQIPFLALAKLLQRSLASLPV